MTNSYEALRPEVERALDRLRPAMEADGGGVEVVRIQDGIVELRLKGSCTCCPSASLTLRRGIEPTLRAALPWVTAVVRVSN